MKICEAGIAGFGILAVLLYAAGCFAVYLALMAVFGLLTDHISLKALMIVFGTAIILLGSCTFRRRI